MPVALLLLNSQVIVTQATQHLLDERDMLFFSLAIYQNVVNIGNYSCINKISQDCINHCLKRCGSVCKTKGHHRILIMAITTTKSRFPFIPLLNPYKIKTGFEVYLCKDLCPLNPIPPLIH